MISVSMEGVKDAVETIKVIIIPWYRENAVRKMKLENAQLQAEIQRSKAETLSSLVKMEREKAAKELDASQRVLILAQAKKAEAEAMLIAAQAAKIVAEVENESNKLREAKLELAFKIARHYGTDMTDVKLTAFALKLLPIIEKLTVSEIEPNTHEEIELAEVAKHAKINILGIELDVKEAK